MTTDNRDEQVRECGRCEGTGELADAYWTCGDPDCCGSGRIECPECNGTGKQAALQGKNELGNPASQGGAMRGGEA